MVSTLRTLLDVYWVFIKYLGPFVLVAVALSWLDRYAIPRYRAKRARSLAQVDRLTGEEFELFLSRLFERKGFQVKLTPRTGDYGVDLILTDPRTGERIAVQAKRYQQRNRVGVRAVQEAYAGKDYYGCSKAIVVTTSYFTENAKQNAKKLGVALIDRNALKEALEQFQEG